MTTITVTTPYSSYKKEVTNGNQKFACGQRVYIRPIYEAPMLHFQDDLITRVEYTYSQAFGDCSPCDQYATEVASWYDERQLMSVSEDCTLEDARERCLDYFGRSHPQLLRDKQDAEDRCPIRTMFKEAVEKVQKDIDKQISEAFREDRK